MYSLRTAPFQSSAKPVAWTIPSLTSRENPDLANGIKFSEYSASALSKAIHKALALYAEPEALNHFRQNAMKTDFSWERTMAEYVKVYGKRIGRVGNRAAKLNITNIVRNDQNQFLFRDFDSFWLEPQRAQLSPP